MSIATELTRISVARDKIRNKLKNIGLSGNIIIDVIRSAKSMYIVCNDEDYSDVTYINPDGNGNNHLSGATIYINTILSLGIYKFTYNGESQTTAHISLETPNGDSYNIGTVSNSKVFEANLHNFIEGNVGDEITLKFTIDEAGSNNAFTIGVERAIMSVINDDSKLDECADALSIFLDEIIASLDI